MEVPLKTHSSSSLKGGRPFKPFEECNIRAKRYKAADLASQYSQEHLAMANSISGEKFKASSYISTHSALAMLVDAELTKYQYESIKYTLQNAGYDILPPYKYVKEEKMKCYPDDIHVSETEAVVNVQSLLDHTTKRLFDSFSEEHVTGMTNLSCTLTSKWGCDGSSSHREYNQSLPADKSDKNIILASMVPLSLVSETDEKYWSNQIPSSTRYCRPLYFEFAKETKEKMLNVYEKIATDISLLKNTDVIVHGKHFQVQHTMLFTMIDGKTAQTITGTSSGAVCFICGAKPTEMNNIEKVVERPISNEACKLGISSLHARIKFMECILHIAYNLPFKKWSTTTDEHKAIRRENKKRIQMEIRDKMGLRVDYVEAGTGTSNNGNTSRRFFSNPSIIAQITGVDEEIIQRFRIILQVITCSRRIDSEKYELFARDTASKFISKYNWYYMPSTVHKVLIHGKQIMDASILPIGMLSEEAEEARNKDYRNYRLLFSRKSARTLTNTDVLNRLLVTSDPFITSIRRVPPKVSLDLDDEVKKMILD